MTTTPTNEVPTPAEADRYLVLPVAMDDEIAATDTWRVDDQPVGKDGVAVKVQTRTVYNAAGDQIVYAFHRVKEYDSLGRLVALSAETRVVVEVPAGP